MANEANNSGTLSTNPKDEMIRLALSYSDSTPEEERLELEAFVNAMHADLWESLPPYDWG
jgi:hypothetical protein